MNRAFPIEELLAHGEFVRALALSLLFDEHRAEDVVQETWLAALRNPPVHEGRVRAWLASVVRRLAAGMMRGEFREDRRRELTQSAAPSATPAEIIERESVRRFAIEAVLSLEEPYRSTILLRFYDGRPPRAIARLQGVPVETVKTRIKRGLSQARERLDRAHGGDRGAWCAALVPLALVREAAPWTGGALALKAAATLVAVTALAVAVWPGARPVPGSVPPPPRLERAALPPPPPPPESAAVAPAPVPPAAPAPAGAPRLGGVVRDADGRPVAGARVLVYPDAIERPVVPGVATDATTDEAGRFSAGLPGRAPGWVVYAEKPGHSPAVLDQVRASDDVRITLDAPRALLGRVRDARSRPVAGARVRWLGLMAGTRVDRETLSAADGTYRIENVPSRRAYTFPGIEHNWLVEVTAEGYAPLTVARGAAQEGGPGEVRFDPVLLEGAVIRGRVIEGDTGRGVPGVPVWVWTARGNDQPHWWPRGRTGHGSPFGQRVRAETMSGPDGEFVVTGVPVLNLHEPAPSQTARGALGPILGYVGALVPGRTPATADLPAATAGERLDVELRSWPAGTVRGRVVDALGRPLARAQVFFHSGERSFHAFPREVEEAPKEHAFTNDEGRYRLPLVPALETGPTVVRLYCLLPTHDWTGGIEVPVVAGGSAEAPDLVVAADPLALIRVTDAAGRPVWGAQASLLERDPDAVFRASRSDEEGRLWCFFRKPGPWTVVVRASGCAAASVPGVVPSLDAPPTLAVTLQPGHRIAGRVVHAGGPPAAGVALGVSRGERLVAWALSREDGSFDVADLPEGPYRVEAALVRRPERPTIQARLEGVPTDARDLIVTIPEREALPEGSALEGSVSSALTREPVLHFRASLAQGSRVLAARLEAPGRFRIDGVPPGRWTLRIEAEGFVPREEELAIGPSGAPGPLDLTLERGTRVRGTVRAPAGLSILVQELAFVDRASGREVPATLARSGAYEAAGLGPGRWVARLRLRPMARRTALALARRHELFVPSGAEVLTVDLDAMAGGQLAVHLPGKGSDTTARLEVRDARGAVVWEGCARVRPFTETLSLPPGAYRVRLEEGGGGPEERAATVDVDGDARVEFPAR